MSIVEYLVIKNIRDKNMNKQYIQYKIVLNMYDCI